MLQKARIKKMSWVMWKQASLNLTNLSSSILKSLTIHKQSVLIYHQMLSSSNKRSKNCNRNYTLNHQHQIHTKFHCIPFDKQQIPNYPILSQLINSIINHFLQGDLVSSHHSYIPLTIRHRTQELILLEI